MSKSRAADPNEGLAADAALAEDLGDEEERRLGQIAEMGGEVADIDDWSPDGLDDGSDPNFKAPDDDGESGGDDDDDKNKDKDDDGDSDDDKDKDKEGSEDDEAGEDDKDKDDAGEAEGEDDASEEEEPAGDSDAGEEDEEEDPAPKSKGIPKHRFDEVNERRKTAEARVAELEAKDKAVDDVEEEIYDFRDNEKQYMDFLLDGKTEEALSKREEIDAAKEAKWKADTKAETHSEVNDTEIQRELSTMSKEAERLYPVFDENHADFEPAMADKVIVFYQGYLQTGAAKNPGDAFVMALADVVEQYKLEDKYNALGGDEDTPAPKPKDKKVDKTKAATKDKSHTPVAGEGAASDDAGAVAPDIENMTDEELEALPPKALSRLRGDFI